MPTTPYTTIYDMDYFCLTNDNILLCRRNGKILQISPSEFIDGDELQTVNKEGTVLWSKAICTTRKVSQGDNIVCLVTQRGVFYLTTKHKMFLEDGKLEAAGNIQVDNRLLYTNKFILPDRFPIGVNKAYVLGSYSAEGSHQEGCGIKETGKWRIVWGLHKDEDIFATKILTNLISAFPGTKAQIDIYPKYTRRTVSSYSKELVSIFHEIGVLGLCDTKRVPSCIFSATKHEKAAYLAGLIEGDGTFKNRCVVLKLTSKALIDGSHLLFEDLGINTKLNFYEDPIDSDQYILTIYGKENLNRLLFWCSSYWYGWKHLFAIQEYSKSNHGNISHSRKDIELALENLYPINSTNFSLQSDIPQTTIKRLYGSWNNCLKTFGYKVKNSRWGTSHVPDNQFTRIDSQETIDLESNKVIKKIFFTLKEQINVYDFTVPETENFLLNTIVSHNSGSQMVLYIGDVLVDEITSLQYATIQQKTPIYGYASQLWDDCAAGQVIVQGTFTINYKEQGYLWAVLRRYFNISGAATNMSVSRADRGLLSGRNKFNRPVKGSNVKKIKRQTVESVSQGKATRGEMYKFYQGLAGYATTQVNNPRDQAFEDIVEAFEDQIWAPKIDNQSLNTQLRRTDDNKFDGFDMYIVFGNYAVPGANHTVQKIIDVRLTSQGKIVKIDGEPIQESYDFIAQTTA